MTGSMQKATGIDPDNWWDEIILGDLDAGFLFGEGGAAPGVGPARTSTVCHFDGHILRGADGIFTHVVCATDEIALWGWVTNKDYCLAHFRKDLGL